MCDASATGRGLLSSPVVVSSRALFGQCTSHGSWPPLAAVLSPLGRRSVAETAAGLCQECHQLSEYGVGPVVRSRPVRRADQLPNSASAAQLIGIRCFRVSAPSALDVAVFTDRVAGFESAEHGCEGNGAEKPRP